MSGHGRLSVGPRLVYAPPLLPVPDIVRCLEDLGVSNLKEKDLQDPKPEVVQKVFEHLIDFTMQKTKDELSQPHFAALDAIKFPEVHDESLPRANFFMSYVMLLAASGARSFSLHDIYKPEPKSLIQNLSFVINFARFRNERLEHVNELTTELEQKQQETETARLALQAIKAHIAELTAAREAEMPAIRKAESEVEALREELAARNRAQAVLHHETSEQKATIHALKDELSAKSVRLAEIQAACDRERSLIVQSPERMKQELRQLAADARDAELELADIDAQKREMRMRVERLAKIDGSVEKLQATLAETLKELEAKKKASKTVKTLQEAVDSHKDTLVEIEGQKKALERSVQRVGEKLSDFRPAAETKLNAARRALAAAKSELDRLSKENVALMEARGVATAKRDAILQKREEERRKHAQMVHDMTVSFSALQERVDGYHGRLRTAIVEANTASL